MSVAPEKCVKECNIVETNLVQGFCPLKIKIPQFPDGFLRKLYKNREKYNKINNSRSGPTKFYV